MTRRDPAYRLVPARRVFAHSSESRIFLNEANEDGMKIEIWSFTNNSANRVNINNTATIVIVDTGRVNLSA